MVFHPPAAGVGARVRSVADEQCGRQVAPAIALRRQGQNWSLVVKLVETCGVGDCLHPKETVPGSKIDRARREVPTIAASIDALTRRYFEKVAGHWSGTYRSRITDHAAMHAAVTRRIDRLRLSMLHHLPAHMETSVSWVNEELVGHTTRIKSLRIWCMDSVEMFRLHDNGNQFTVAMSQRLAPTFSLKRVFPEGHGEVNAECDGATYYLPWIGGLICQHTKITDRGVELRQSTPWLSGSVLLVKQSARVFSREYTDTILPSTACFSIPALNATSVRRETRIGGKSSLGGSLFRGIAIQTSCGIWVPSG